MIKYTQITIIFMVGALLQGFGSALGAAQQRSNILDSLSAQAEENKKNREFNFMLAQKQNEWNIQQWERSNEYNTPLNQMLRLKEAGLNPNLVYGNGAGQSLAVPNPQLTSGAPSTPQDMSLISQRPTVGQVITNALNNESIRAQIDKIKADTRKTNADAGISETQAKYEEQKQKLGLDMSRVTYDKLKEELTVAENLAIQSSYQIEATNYEALSRRLEFLYKEREMEAIIKKLESEADISEKEAKFAIESYMYRLMGVQAEGELAKFNATMPVQLKEKFGDDAPTIALILQGVNYLLGHSNDLGALKKLTKSK